MGKALLACALIAKPEKVLWGNGKRVGLWETG